jgi:cadmium resistance protein CadD (predicted permease)
LGIAAFVATNLDDLFLILLFLSHPQFKTLDIIVGQFLGIIALVAASLVGSFVAQSISFAYVSLLGIVPIFMGIKSLLGKKDENPNPGLNQQTHRSRSAIWTVSWITIANGGDNLSIYIPLFSTRAMWEIFILFLVFMGMTAVWCYVGFFLIHHPRLEVPIRRHGKALFPWFLIALGCWILGERFLRATFFN